MDPYVRMILLYELNIVLRQELVLTSQSVKSPEVAVFV
jgi:hypothetical protein